MKAEDKFTVTISLEVDRKTGGPGKEGIMSTMDIIYNNMDYADVVGVEALVSMTLVPALVEAGFTQAEAMGLDMTPVRGYTKGKK